MRDERDLSAVDVARAEADARPLLVHVHISRTGGSTLNHILRSSYGARHCAVEPWDSRWGADPFDGDDLAKLLRIYPRLRSIAGHRLYGYVDLATPDRDAAYFAMVRDPVRACASRFQHKVEHNGWAYDDFDGWIEKDWSRNRHTKAIAGSEDVEAAKRLIREKGIFMGLTDRYDASMLMMKRLVAPDLNIAYEPVNVASKRTVSRTLLADDRRRQLIEDAQSADIELQRFVDEELWPEYIEAYGDDFEGDVAEYTEDRGSFNQLNIAMSRVKSHAIYKPALALHRWRGRG